MIVQKFGGTSVADAGRILSSARIVQSHRGDRPVVVVSALAGVTDALVRAIDASAAGDKEQTESQLADLERKHRWVLPDLAADSGARHDLDLWLDATFEELRQYLRSVRFLGEVTARARDTLLAFGERWSARLMVEALRGLDVDARWVDPTTVVSTDARHGAAVADVRRTSESCRSTLTPLLEGGSVPVIGGFTGASPEGRTTTLGRGGGDTSAAVVGCALGVEEIQIWTDVDGLMTADPRLVPGARTLARVTFAEAAELAFYGAKILHPSSIEPAVRRNIPVRIRNASRPSNDGTEIVEDDGRPGRLVSVASRSDVVLFRVRSPRLTADAAVLGRVARALDQVDTVPDLLASSELGIAMAVREGPSTGMLRDALAACGAVTETAGMGVVCVVGSGLVSDAELRGRVLVALGDRRPDVVSMGGSGNAVAAVLVRSELGETVRSLHAAFFESGGCR